MGGSAPSEETQKHRKLRILKHGLDGKSEDGTLSWWEGKARKEKGKNKRTGVGGRRMRYKDGMEK